VGMGGTGWGSGRPTPGARQRPRRCRNAAEMDMRAVPEDGHAPPALRRPPLARWYCREPWSVCRASRGTSSPRSHASPAAGAPRAPRAGGPAVHPGLPPLLLRHVPSESPRDLRLPSPWRTASASSRCRCPCLPLPRTVAPQRLVRLPVVRPGKLWCAASAPCLLESAPRYFPAPGASQGATAPAVWLTPYCCPPA